MKAKRLTPKLAKELFVTDQMTCLRVAIYGDDKHQAHPSPGVVVESYYADQLSAMTNSRNAKSNILFFANKILDGTTTFPHWCKNSDGILPLAYARMLADYLQFMKMHSFSIDILGINCEPEANESMFTAAKHKATIDELRRLSKSPEFSFIMPPHIIGPDTITCGYGFAQGNAKGAQFIKDLKDTGNRSCLDMVGTHYYHGDSWRPRSSLEDFCHEAGNRPKWNTELHWGKRYQGNDVIENAEKSMDTLFDCIDAGMTGFVWWSYKRTEDDLAGSLNHRLTLSTLHSRPIDMDDLDGRSIIVPGHLVTRGFRKSQDITLWVINNSNAVYAPCKFRLATQSIADKVVYTQWTATGSKTGAATRIDKQNFSVGIPVKTLTQISFSLTP